MIQYQIFDDFVSNLTDAKIYAQYEMSLLKKAKPSDAIGECHGNKAKGIIMYSRYTKEDRAKVNAVFLYGKGHNGIKPFEGALPNGIIFEMSRTEVQKILGKPDWSIEKGGEGIMAIANSADKWFTKNKEGFRVEYDTDDKSISIISLSSAEQEADWAL